MNTLHNCAQTGDTSSIKSYTTSLSRYEVELNIAPALIMSSYVVTHMKNLSPTGGDDSMNACGNLDMLTLHIAVRMLEMLCAVTSSLTMIIIFLNGSVTTNMKKLYSTIANSIQMQSDIFFCYNTLSGQTGALESDALIIMQTASRSNQPFFAIRTDWPTDRSARERHDNNNNTAFAISQTTSRSNQPFFATIHFPGRQKRCVLYDARERRANNNANSIHIQSAIFFAIGQKWPTYRSDALSMLLESDVLIIIIIQRLQSHTLTIAKQHPDPDRQTDRQEC